MSTLHKIEDEYIMYTKGAIDVLLQRVEFIFDHGQIRPISDTDRANIQEANLKLSQQGLRVLAFAKKTLDQDRPLTLEDENGYTFLGLISMIDPPREESAAAVRDCKRAGIKAIMITGDHKITASSIARQIGIFNDGDRSLDGVELDQMSDEELSEILPTVSVYARVSPEHKIRIVDLWQKKGQIVAMTGDGVNDAPALKKADIGIAMGITGTEVSKDAASMILTDDNFATIVKSIANGRNIYNNIKNSIKFLISGNMSGILSVLYSVAVGLTMPFTAVHLLFINLMTDSLPAIAISTEPPAKNLLDEKPRRTKRIPHDQRFYFGCFGAGFPDCNSYYGCILYRPDTKSRNGKYHGICYPLLRPSFPWLYLSWKAVHPLIRCVPKSLYPACFWCRHSILVLCFVYPPATRFNGCSDL